MIGGADREKAVVRPGVRQAGPEATSIASALDALEDLYEEPEARPNAVEWPALQFRDVFKIFRSPGVETVALRGLDLDVATGELVAVLGPSGCGKSTLLHLAAGLDEPSAGDVRAFGRSLSRLDEAELADYRAREVAVVFQSNNLWPGLSAVENLIALTRLAGLDNVDERVRDALAAFGLSARAGQPAGMLSGGEQQRAAIAAAAARHAPLVLADEPTGELDVTMEGAVLEAFQELRSEFGAAAVMVTHSARVADAADRVVELKDGKVVL